jgi:DNA repair protein RadC
MQGGEGATPPVSRVYESLRDPRQGSLTSCEETPVGSQDAKRPMNTIIYTTDAEGSYREATFDEIMTAARHALALRVRKGTPMQSPKASRDFLMMKLADREHEVFTLIYLDNRHRLIAYQELFRGTIDGASVHPREVVKEALKHNAAAVILAHNHPSGVAEPSKADELITNRLKDALALVDIRVLDHLIVAGSDVISFAERGLL